ncbi:MAG: hypothetical protein AB7N90_11400 [Vicinamibacterales bacterium]
MAQAVVAVAPAIFVFAMALVMSRKGVIRRLEQAGATSAGAAADGRQFKRAAGWWLPRLVAAGVVHDAGGGRVWLDTAAWQAYRGVRRKRAMTALAAFCAALAALWVAGVIGGGPR